MGRRWLVSTVLGLAACGGTNTADPACNSPAGSITDLGSEPHFSANYLHRWSIDSCLVRLDVLMSRDSGCGPNDMVMGTPLGTSNLDGGARIYVGGNTTNLGGDTTGFDPAALLPPSATDTGFRQSARELWMVPNDDGFAFLRSSADGHVEAWPLERSVFGCQ